MENKQLLQLIEDDSTLTPAQLAVMLNKEEGEIRALIGDYEKKGIILAYKALIDWDKTDKEYVSALIEIKVTPQRDSGFDQIADRISQYPEVQSIYLMSGGFDFAVMIEGRTMKEVALFVAKKLAPIENVVSTATHFVLRKYKDKGVIFGAAPADERGNCI